MVINKHAFFGEELIEVENYLKSERWKKNILDEVTNENNENIAFFNNLDA
jgi:hypothetical protein